MTSRKAVLAARDAIGELGVSVKTWAVTESPWDDKVGAQIRTAGGRLVAEFSDPDEASAVLRCIRLLDEITGGGR